MDPNTNTDSSKELTRVFVSYAREDRKWLDPDNPRNLIPFLEDSLRRQNVVFWYDKGLVPGDEFKRLIGMEIDQAQIALLIVSQYFLNSVFIETEEMPRIANRAGLGRMVIVPILVESCDWNEYGFLADRQMVPASRPLIEFTDSDIRWSSVRKEILDGVKAQVKRIRAAQDAPPEQGNQESPVREVALQEAAERAAITAQQSSPAIDPPANNIEQENRQEEAADQADAMELYKEQERICRELGNKAGLQDSLHYQGLILYARGDLDGAMALYKESELIIRELGNKEWLWRVLSNQAAILKDSGALDGAMTLYGECERLCRELGNKDGLQLLLGRQGGILYSRGNGSAAMALYEEQERICRELGNKAGLQECLHYKGLILYARGDLDGAMAHYKESELIIRELGNKDWLWRVLSNQALILKDRGDLDGAMALRKEEERLCRELGNKDGLQASLGSQAAIIEARKIRASASVPDDRKATPRRGVDISDGASASQASHTWAVPSTPHPSADGNRAQQLNLKYQAEKKKWDSLPWRKRIRTPEPKPPTGI
jgi:tetratricopeptide (TPR) repeat protein